MAKKLFKFQPGKDEGGKMFQRFLNFTKKSRRLDAATTKHPIWEHSQLHELVKASYNKQKIHVR
jgi:hypothetical protein